MTAHESHRWERVRLHGIPVTQCAMCGAREGSQGSRTDCAEFFAKHHG